MNVELTWDGLLNRSPDLLIISGGLFCQFVPVISSILVHRREKKGETLLKSWLIVYAFSVKYNLTDHPDAVDIRIGRTGSITCSAVQSSSSSLGFYLQIRVHLPSRGTVTCRRPTHQRWWQDNQIRSRLKDDEIFFFFFLYLQQLLKEVVNKTVKH